MSRRLVAPVVVHDGRSSRQFQAGDVLPKDLEKLVTNPAAFLPEGEGGEASELAGGAELQPQSGGEQPVPAKPAPQSYADLNLTQLDALLAKRDLVKSGNKPEKVARLEEHDGLIAAEKLEAELQARALENARSEHAASEGQPAPASDPEQGQAETEYSEQSDAELQAQLGELELPVDGERADWIARLKQYDADQ